MTRDEWLAEFVREVDRLRPDLTYGEAHVRRVGLSEWSKQPGADPAEAARAWDARVKSAGEGEARALSRAMSAAKGTAPDDQRAPLADPSVVRTSFAPSALKRTQK